MQQFLPDIVVHNLFINSCDVDQLAWSRSLLHCASREMPTRNFGDLSRKCSEKEDREVHAMAMRSHAAKQTQLVGDIERQESTSQNTSGDRVTRLVSLLQTETTTITTIVALFVVGIDRTHRRVRLCGNGDHHPTAKGGTSLQWVQQTVKQRRDFHQRIMSNNTRCVSFFSFGFVSGDVVCVLAALKFRLARFKTQEPRVQLG